MKPFERGYITVPPPRQFAEAFNLTMTEARDQCERLKKDEIWINDLYQVNIDRNPSHGFPYGLVHLSIKRRDKQPVHDWRHLQRIKNMLCGDEAEGIEIYPAESRLADSANQYHLWVFEKGVTVPCGFGDRLVSGKSQGGAIQRPFENEDNY